MTPNLSSAFPPPVLKGLGLWIVIHDLIRTAETKRFLAGFLRGRLRKMNLDKTICLRNNRLYHLYTCFKKDLLLPLLSTSTFLMIHNSLSLCPQRGTRESSQNKMPKVSYPPKTKPKPLAICGDGPLSILVCEFLSRLSFLFEQLFWTFVAQQFYDECTIAILAQIHLSNPGEK